MFSYASIKTAEQHPLASFRNPVDGPELRVVQSFCEELSASPLGDMATTVFVEPKIHGCFPDLVIVQWDPEVSETWCAARAELEAGDTYWLHYINELGAVDRQTICQRQGNKRGANTWERLASANVAVPVHDELRRKPLAEVYAVKRLIAVEAKVGNWRRGLEQAFQNTWFASESYLLLDQLGKKNGLFERANELGIGLLQPGSSFESCPLPARCGALPLSHASWLFNESVWRSYPSSIAKH